MDLYSLSVRASYRKIPWSLESARSDVVMIVSLWNLTNLSATLLSRCLSNLERLEKSKPESRGFESLGDLAVRRPPAYWIEAHAPIAPFIFWQWYDNQLCKYTCGHVELVPFSLDFDLIRSINHGCVRIREHLNAISHRGDPSTSSSLTFEDVLLQWPV